MIGGELGVHLVGGASELDGLETAVVGGELLLHDVGLDGYAEVVSLTREIGGSMVVCAVLLKAVVAQVAPEDGGHTQLMRISESLGYVHNLATALFRTEVDGGSHGYGAHVPCLLDGTEHHLIVGVGVSQQFVVIDLHYEGDLVGILTSHSAKDTVRGGHGIATAFDGQLDDVFGIEVDGVRGERCAGRVLDTLVNGEDGDVSRTSQAAVVVEGGDAVQRLRIAVGIEPNAIDGVGSRRVNQALVNGFALVGQVVVCLCTQ